MQLPRSLARLFGKKPNRDIYLSPEFARNACLIAKAAVQASYRHHILAHPYDHDDLAEYVPDAREQADRSTLFVAAWLYIHLAARNGQDFAQKVLATSVIPSLVENHLLGDADPSHTKTVFGLFVEVLDLGTCHDEIVKTLNIPDGCTGDVTLAFGKAAVIILSGTISEAEKSSSDALSIGSISSWQLFSLLQPVWCDAAVAIAHPMKQLDEIALPNESQLAANVAHMKSCAESRLGDPEIFRARLVELGVPLDGDKLYAQLRIGESHGEPAASEG